MTKNLTTKYTKSNSTIKYFKLIDGSMIVGDLVNDSDEEYFQINNAVLLGSVETETLEQKYYFVGMHCPFSTDNPIVTRVLRSTIISINSNLDSHLEKQYNKFVNSWFNARDKLNSLENEDLKSEIEQKLETLVRAISNTTIH